MIGAANVGPSRCLQAVGPECGLIGGECGPEPPLVGAECGLLATFGECQVMGQPMATRWLVSLLIYQDF